MLKENSKNVSQKKKESKLKYIKNLTFKKATEKLEEEQKCLEKALSTKAMEEE